MTPDWLLDDPLRRTLMLALMLLPLAFILFSRRAGWPGRILWGLFSQLPWAFVASYLWVWQARYGGDAGAPVSGAFGWWVLAFPWGVYLLYRATRKWFPGERR